MPGMEPHLTRKEAPNGRSASRGSRGYHYRLFATFGDQPGYLRPCGAGAYYRYVVLHSGTIIWSCHEGNVSGLLALTTRRRQNMGIVLRELESPVPTKVFTIANLLFLLYSPYLLSAEPNLFVGAKGGANVSWVTGSDWDEDIVRLFDGENKGRFGATVGGFVSAVFPSRYGIRAELLYSEHGGRVDFRINGNDAELRARSVMLDVSLLGERFFGVGQGAISVFLGPTLLLLQGDLVTEIRTNGETLETEEAQEAEQIFGATGGIGYSHPLGPGVLLFDIRYTRGLTGYNRDKAYDNAVTVLAGYGFPF
jgi:hypothetical protein